MGPALCSLAVHVGKHSSAALVRPCWRICKLGRDSVQGLTGLQVLDVSLWGSGAGAAAASLGNQGSWAFLCGSAAQLVWVETKQPRE